MPHASTLANMSPGLLKVVERAQHEPEGRFHALAHLIDVPALGRAYRRQRSDAAVGVDGVTKEQYGQTLEANLKDLHARLKAQRYRHQPIRRVHIPKAQGKTRPIGVSAFEDKVVQDAVREVLEAIYEQDFLECSYGFRPGRSAHDAVRTLTRSVDQGEVRWIFEADIVSFFDSLDRTEFKKMLEVRVADGSLLRLIGQCLHVGVLDDEAVVEPELGTVQGSVLSPLLGNVYLHYVLDRWFATEVKPRLRGKATLIRYCDDCSIGFEREEEARRVLAVLEKRLGRFGLTLHPDKTRLLPFGRPPQAQQRGKSPATFDFLGFTFYWGRSRKGYWRMGCKTRRASLRRAKQAIYDWCRRHRH
jgi:RNA-directed DNA polymerase